MQLSLVLLCALCCVFKGQGQRQESGQTGDRIQVQFTPTVCKVRCVQGRCVNLCDRGEVTTVYSSDGSRGAEEGNAFRVFLCPLLCKNGGLCLQKDRCLCPPNFTGKFCQIPLSSNASSANLGPPSANQDAGSNLLSANQELTRSEFVLPLGPNQETQSAGAPSPHMVKVRVQHPPEASVQVHQVLKVPGSSLRTAGVTSGSAGFPAPVPRGVQAQTVTGTGTFSQNSGFKYCFREAKDGQCSSPLPGLRSRDTCCRGVGKAWGINHCELCPNHADKGNNSCPVGFKRVNGTKCEDINECMEPGRCENGLCVNTRGSYSCVCRAGFILDATHGLCISHSVISEEKGRCFRVVSPLSSLSSCSLPILRSITKQICCCSRVGKAWGEDCQRCPPFGSAAFKEICPAGPGYHYSASALQFTQRAIEQLGHRGAPLLPSNSTDSSRTQDTLGSSSGSELARSRPVPPQTNSRPVLMEPKKPGPPESSPSRSSSPQAAHRASDAATSSKPVQSSVSSSRQPDPKPQPALEQGSRSPPRPEQTVGGNALPRPRSPVATATKRPIITTNKRPVTVTIKRPVITTTTTTTKRPTTTSTRPPRVHGAVGACEARPGVCGRGLCVNQPMGRYRCLCDHGYQPNPLNTSCQDTDECAHSPCGPNGRCENSPGSFRCVCHRGYKLRGDTCTDVDECEDPLLCPGQECVNSVGSYRCVSCRPGFGLLHRLCTDIDECRQAPCTNGRCENTPGSYRCICRHGYRPHNNTCSDIDECADPSQCPGQMCVNTAGSYRCVSCRHGYRLHNRQCIDIDECEKRKPCPGQKCVNSEGSYSCVSCSEGYSSVNGVCTDIDECADPSQCPGQMCVNSVGSYRCVSCRPGYSARDGSCHDVDECSVPGACPSERVCVNSMGSFSCNCPPGYSSGLGRSCRDIDECLLSGQCSGGDCVNTLGSFSCVCTQGFSLNPNGTSCTDVDECARPSVCEHGRCLNSPGSFHCDCNSGFSPSPERNACLDVDECVSSLGSVCGAQRCENTIGSYRCLASCPPGYQASPSGNCVDVDECSSPQVCGAHASCVNLIGAYQCQCDQGYSSAADGTSCEASPGSVPSTSAASGSSHSSGDSSHSSRISSHSSTGSSHSSAGSSPSVSVPSLSVDSSSRSSLSPAGSSPSVDSSRSSLAPAGSSPSVDSSSRFSLPPAGSSPSVDSSSRSSLPPAGSSPSIDSSSRSSLPPAGRGELRECYYNLSERGVCSVLSPNSTLQECCCTEGQGWGRGCVYHTCPRPHTAEFQVLCPNGRGYITTGPGAFDYKDVDECKRFGPEVCKSGVCVNNIPGFSCYCPSGYVFNHTLLQCTDHDECEEESCSGGVCVNTEGSFYCSCPHPLVLDDTQRTCINATEQSLDEHVSLCWQTVSADLLCQSLLLGAQLSFSDCCCLYGQGWGMECALCPQPDTDDYASLCSSVHSPFYPDTFSDSRTPIGSRPGSRPGPGRGGASVPYFPPFTSELYPPLDYDGGAGGRFDPGYSGPPYGGGYFPEPDYDTDQTRPYGPDESRFSPDGSSFSPDSRLSPETRFNPDSSFSPDGSRFSSDSRLSPETWFNPDSSFSPDGSRFSPDSRLSPETRFNPDSSFSPDGSRFSPDTRFSPETRFSADPRFSPDSAPFLVPPDPRSEQAFEVQPPPASDPSLYTEAEEQEWRGFPPFTRPGPRRVYDRRFEAAAEDCGIVDGCVNGRCIRVAEGYTCDCYHGYELDLTAMTCIDINECEGGVRLEFPCVNARCVNTEGSYRCVCRRGYVLSRRPHHCVAA